MCTAAARVSFFRPSVKPVRSWANCLFDREYSLVAVREAKVHPIKNEHSSTKKKTNYIREANVGPIKNGL